MPEEIYQIFQDNYVNVEEPYKLIDFVLNKQADGTFKGNVHLHNCLGKFDKFLLA